MKHLVLLFSALLTSVSIFAQTIPNAGFETWTTNTETAINYLTPQNWITQDIFITSFFNSFGDSTYEVHSVTQTASAHSGNSAVQMDVVASNLGDTVAGFIGTANSIADFWNAFSGAQAFGYPFAARPANLTGYYQANTLGNDSSIIGLVLTKWNTVSSSRDTLFYGERYLANVGNWTVFSLPITYSFSVFPDTAYISSGILTTNNGHIGSTMKLDDLAFTGNVPIGIAEATEAQHSVQIFPNPFQESATLVAQVFLFDRATLKVYDVLGNLVMQQNNISGSIVGIEREGLQAGVYFYTIEQTDRVFACGKLSIQ